MKKGKIFAVFVIIMLGVITHTEAQSFNLGLGKGINFMAKDSSLSVKIGFRFQTLVVAEKTIGTS